MWMPERRRFRKESFILPVRSESLEELTMEMRFWTCIRWREAGGLPFFSKQANFVLGDKQVTLLDTPGHVDFSAEMERTLQVLDYAILVVSGADGVQGHTRTLWNLLARYQVPTFIFINKMDQDGTDRQDRFTELKRKLSGECVDFTEAGEEFLEELSMCDETVMESYLEMERSRRARFRR